MLFGSLQFQWFWCHFVYLFVIISVFWMTGSGLNWSFRDHLQTKLILFDYFIHFEVGKGGGVDYQFGWPVTEQIGYFEATPTRFLWLQWSHSSHVKKKSFYFYRLVTNSPVFPVKHLQNIKTKKKTDHFTTLLQKLPTIPTLWNRPISKWNKKKWTILVCGCFYLLRNQSTNCRSAKKRLDQWVIERPSSKDATAANCNELAVAKKAALCLRKAIQLGNPIGIDGARSRDTQPAVGAALPGREQQTAPRRSKQVQHRHKTYNYQLRYLPARTEKTKHKKKNWTKQNEENKRKGKDKEMRRKRLLSTKYHGSHLNSKTWKIIKWN